jgi:hypothetical protein
MWETITHLGESVLHDTDLEAENSGCMGHRDRRAALRVFPTALLK